MLKRTLMKIPAICTVNASNISLVSHTLKCPRIQLAILPASSSPTIFVLFQLLFSLPFSSSPLRLLTVIFLLTTLLFSSLSYPSCPLPCSFFSLFCFRSFIIDFFLLFRCLVFPFNYVFFLIHLIIFKPILSFFFRSHPRIFSPFPPPPPSTTSTFF